MAHPRQMQPGTLLWEEGEQAIWARTIWDGQDLSVWSSQRRYVESTA